MKFRYALLSAAILASLGGCASMSQISTDQALGTELYHQGAYARSRLYLMKALRSEEYAGGTRPTPAQQTEMWKLKNLIARTYWESGDDAGLLKFSAKALSRGQAKRWWCMILQRRGHLGQAEKCYVDVGDANALKQTYLEGQVLSTFLGRGYRFGYRPAVTPAQRP